MKSYVVFGMSMFVALSLLTGCGSGGGETDAGGGEGTTPPATAPEISAPLTSDFGVVLLDRYSEREIVVNNLGTVALDVSQISLGSPSSGFSIQADNCSNKSLQASGACTLKIRLTPGLTQADQASYSDNLSIPSNDSDENPFVINLTGKGRALNVSINQILTENCPHALMLLVSVTDTNDNPVILLEAADFTVFENGNLKNIIPPIRNAASKPISATLILDYSGSLPDADRQAMETAAQAFIDNLNFALDEASIVKFALTIGATQSFTSDQATLDAFIGLPYPGDINGTILYDATLDAIAQYGGRPAGSKRFVIVFSDGNDEESTSTLADVINSALNNGVPVFTIAYTGALNSKPEIMQQLAQETGGQFFTVSTTGDLNNIYQTISTILSDQYLIEYATSSGGGGTVSVDVKVTNGSDHGEASKNALGCP